MSTAKPETHPVGQTGGTSLDADDPRTYEHILGNMAEGVMTIGPDGRIRTFNASAARMLGVRSDEVVGRLYAETLLRVDGAEEFNDAVMAAVYEKAEGRRQFVTVQSPGSEQRLYALTASYMRDDGGTEGRVVGVICVFRDVTEVESLREARLKLAESLEQQHGELQRAYRETRTSNEELQSALKKVQVARVTATALVIDLFATVGIYVWRSGTSAAEASVVSVAPATEPRGVETVVVVPRRMTSEVSFTGTLAPRREVNIVSPITGNVAAIHFRYGERVEAGQRLIELDTVEAERQLRDARVAHIQAMNEFDKVENWESSSEVLRAERAVRTARLDLASSETELADTVFLLEKGVISASEHEATERRHEMRRGDLESALRDLAATLELGGDDARRVAQLALENATTSVEQLEGTLRNATIEASTTGVVLQPRYRDAAESRGRGGAGPGLARGQSVSQGELLVTIGDVEGVSVGGLVDEADVLRLRVGQAATISGGAFPGLELEGKVVHVSSQASAALRSGLPSFDVTVVAQHLDAADAQRLRLGMSANVAVTVRDEPGALLVPLTAVHAEGDTRWVDVRVDESRFERVQVRVGETTLDSVEVLDGIEAGDELAVSPNGFSMSRTRGLR